MQRVVVGSIIINGCMVGNKGVVHTEMDADLYLLMEQAGKTTIFGSSYAKLIVDFLVRTIRGDDKE